MVKDNHNKMITLKSKITKKILNLFFLNEEKRFYINELAKIIDEDVSNTHKKLIQLKDEGIILDEFQGKERYFFLNKKYPFLKEYKKISLEKIGFENLLKEEFKKIKKIKKAYIFGSYANDKLSNESDIDLLVVGDFNIVALQKVILKIQKNIDKEINSINLSSKEFKKKKEDNDPFLEDIFSKKYIEII